MLRSTKAGLTEYVGVLREGNDAHADQEAQDHEGKQVGHEGRHDARQPGQGIAKDDGGLAAIPDAERRRCVKA